MEQFRVGWKAPVTLKGGFLTSMYERSSWGYLGSFVRKVLLNVQLRLSSK